MKSFHFPGLAASVPRLPAVLAIILFSSSAVFAQVDAPPNASQPGVPSAVTAVPAVSTDPRGTLNHIDLDNYRLTPGDSVAIQVYQEDDITTNAHITTAGTVTIPLIGQVKITGYTTREAADKIRDTLIQKEILVSPRVTVTLQAASQNSFIMLGQITKPGTYSFSSQETVNLVQAIAMAGGLTRIANAHDVTVVRRDGGVQQNFHLDAKKMTLRSDVVPFIVKSGDVITIGETFF